MSSTVLAVDAVIQELAQGLMALPIWRTELQGLATPGPAVLSAPAHAPLDWPPAHLSAMDGFAFAHQGLRTEPLRLMGSAAPGHAFSESLRAGQAIRIATGAVMPPGTDTVCPSELAHLDEGVVHVPSSLRPGQHVRHAGEDLRRGDIVAGPGLLTLGQRMALCAMGVMQVSVLAPLRVATLGIGSELAQEAGFFDANQPTIRQAMSAWPAICGAQRVCIDSPDAIAGALRSLAAEHDLIISTGAMADGHSDHWFEACEHVGSAQRWTLAMRPGRRLGLARVGPCGVIGLPGTPGAMLSMLMAVVEPALAMGFRSPLGFRSRQVAHLAEDWSKPPHRTEVHRIRWVSHRPGWVQSAGRMAPSLLQPWTQTDALMLLAHDQGDLKAGDEVAVITL